MLQRCAAWLDGVRQDAAYMARHFRRQPGFAAIAVLTLGLGIGANTAIFSVIDTLLLRPPSFEHAGRIVSFRESNPQKIPFEVNLSPGNFLDWREQHRAFDELAAWRNWYFTVAQPGAGANAPEAVRGVRVSPAFFSMIGVRPALGRAFRREEEVPGADRSVLLSDGIWKRRFGGDRGIVGQTILVDGVPCSVVGVLPPDFLFFQADLDIWMPLAVDAPFHDRQNHSVMVFGRLAPGVSLPEAQAEADAIARRLGQAYPDTNEGWIVKLRPLSPTDSVRAVRPALIVLLAAAGLVLLIACANVANLLLARAAARRKEMIVRAALGASRARLVRQMLTESIILALASGAAGTLVAHQGIGVLVPLLPHVGTNKTIDTFRSVAPILDGRMLAFSIGVAALAGIVFGSIPAFQTTRVESLRVWSSPALRPRTGRLLMVAELALSIALVTGAGLLVESFWRLQRVDPGFPADHLLTMQLWLPRAKYATAGEVRRFYDQVIQRVGALSGVRGASGVSFRPFLSMGMGAPFEIEGRPPARPDAPLVSEYRVVTPGYVRVLGQPLSSGRDFTEHDGPDSEGVAIVNEAMARQFWPNEDPVGKRLRPAFHRSDVPWEVDAAPRWLTVVGVVRDIKGYMPSDRSQSQLYVSSRQFPFSYMFLVVRTETPPLGLAAAIQDQIRRIDPDQPVSDIRTMDDAISVSVPRFNVELLGLFALVAVFLAAVGVYGVTSYGVSARAQEIGVRMALGAQSRDVLAMVLREALAVGIVGAGVGLIASLAFTRAMSGLLYGIAPTDVPMYVAAASILLAVVLLACYVPARRAARVDPAVTLRAL
jgi:putative ABC transport system permease protein